MNLWCIILMLHVHFGNRKPFHRDDVEAMMTLITCYFFIFHNIAPPSNHSTSTQMIVPKRAALLLDRLMVALHHALEDGDQEGVRRISDMYRYSRQQQQQQPLLQQLQSLTPSTASLLSNVAATGAYPAAKESTSKFVPNFSFEGIFQRESRAG